MTDSRELGFTDIDVIVVGTGMGGATIGYALAKAGKKVLFCESGRAHIDPGTGLRGKYAELFFDKIAVPQLKHRQTLLDSGRWAEMIEDLQPSHSRSFIPFIGNTGGGSSALYGMALERFFPSDFQPRANFPDHYGANLPECWPISYGDLEPYYTEAEKLFRVRGTHDPIKTDTAPLVEPPPLSAPNQELFDFLSNKGFHPYRIPLACEFAPDCNGCQGFLCAQKCKNDSNKICLEPAINKYGAKLLDNCNVTKLEADGDRVIGVHCNWQEKEIYLQAPLIILAAGALKTPQILLNSKSKEWPNGLANDSGLVGKNLMRHYIDLYAISTHSKDIEGHMKEIAINDFYFRDGEKLGTIQSFGHLPPAQMLVETVENDLGEISKLLSLGFKLGKPITKKIISAILSHRVILASIMEDLPYQDNRVSLDESDGHLVIHYSINPGDKKRIENFRRYIRDILKPYSFMAIKEAENTERIAHVCGTCRFGNDPNDSVLNSVNRAHHLENLYVVDSSFFPSSGGTNPALTIAANALRVARHILDSH